MTNLHIHHRVGALVRATLLWLLLAVLTLPASAITKRDADEAYRKGNFQQAIDDYRELLHRGVSAELYYNLGNAYYRSDNLTQAILAYERASLLSPGDDDIRFNLQFARSKTIDKITPEGETEAWSTSPAWIVGPRSACRPSCWRCCSCWPTSSLRGLPCARWASSAVCCLC